MKGDDPDRLELDQNISQEGPPKRYLCNTASERWQGRKFRHQRRPAGGNHNEESRGSSRQDWTNEQTILDNQSEVTRYEGKEANRLQRARMELERGEGSDSRQDPESIAKKIKITQWHDVVFRRVTQRLRQVSGKKQTSEDTGMNEDHMRPHSQKPKDKKSRKDRQERIWAQSHEREHWGGDMDRE